MDLFAKRPRERAQLGLTDAEVARRAGLNERRYGHYVRGNREPRFGTFDAHLRCDGRHAERPITAEKSVRSSAQDRWLERLLAAGRRLGTEDIELAVKQVASIAEHRNSKRYMRRFRCFKARLSRGSWVVPHIGSSARS